MNYIEEEAKRMQAIADAAKVLCPTMFMPPQSAPLKLPVSIPRHSAAGSTATSVMREIALFQNTLSDDEEISRGPVGVEHIRVDSVRADGDDLLIFCCTNSSGARAVLIQNVAQTNVLLEAQQKKGEKAHRIGFDLSQTQQPSTDNSVPPAGNT